MTEKPKIAMSPDELPAQRIHEVVKLPPKPEGFAPVISYGADTESIFPKRRPGEMLYLGSTEWAWSPMHNRISAYHLHRGRHYWLLYIQDLDADMPEYEWTEAAYVSRNGVDEQQAAVHLMIAIWKDETSTNDLDEFHWINEEGQLATPEWMAIAREVWGAKK